MTSYRKAVSSMILYKIHMSGSLLLKHEIRGNFDFANECACGAPLG
jgi:hypothetical protein